MGAENKSHSLLYMGVLFSDRKSKFFSALTEKTIENKKIPHGLF